jgi:anti-anti-sigma factor
LVWWKEERSFGGEELQLVEGIVRQGAIAVENARLLEEARERAEEATGLSNIGVLLASTRDMDEILAAVYDEASKIMDTTGFGVALYDKAKDEIQFELFIDQGQRLEKFGGPASDAPLNAWIIYSQQAILVRDPDKDVFPTQEMVMVGGDWLPKSFVGVPLVYKERAIGAITVQSEKPFAFDLHQKQVLEGIAHLAAPALANARLVRQLQEAVHAQAQLLATIQELGTPLIPVAEGIVVLPLIGHIDHARAQSIMENLLNGIFAHQAEVVLIDITGVPTVDTTVANSLLQAAQAARLLGTHVMLVGVRPEVAHTIVNLGIDLGGITNFANLQTGIAAALAMRGLRITPASGKL